VLPHPARSGWCGSPTAVTTTLPGPAPALFTVPRHCPLRLIGRYRARRRIGGESGPFGEQPFPVTAGYSPPRDERERPHDRRESVSRIGRPFCRCCQIAPGYPGDEPYRWRASPPSRSAARRSARPARPPSPRIA
jgi:hypothetical protein